MPRSASFLRSCLVGALFLGFALPVAAQDRTRSVVRAGGQGTVRVSPDRAVVRLSVVRRAETAEQARTQNASAAKRTMNAVRALDVPDENLRMETLRLQPRREYNPETKTYEEKGYEAIRQVVVQVDRLEILPQIVARAVQEGANRLQGINYQLSDRSEVRDEALRKAAREARDKAHLLASTLDATLGTVHQIEEQNVEFDEPRPRLMMQKQAAAGEAAGEPEAYAAGKIEISARVRVVFNLQSE